MKRSYRLGQRAQAQARTRQRIVEAIVALHEEVGPARTSISAVAERAGVERLTVYRHFPDELSQFVACSAHWSAHHPAPDPEPWGGIADPPQRLRTALAELYAFYRRGEPMLANILRDAPQLPPLQRVIEPFGRYIRSAIDVLAAGWTPDRRGTTLARAAVAHAVEFQTWRSLVGGQRLSQRDAVELMCRMVAAAANDGS